MSAREDAAGSFERSAADYDEILAANRRGAERLAAALPPGDYRDLLDVGCGTGFTTEAMVARHPIRRVVGVDPSPAMLERFRAKLDRLGDVEVTLHEAGVDRLPVPEASVDAAVSGMAFHWFPDKPAAVRAMARTLRPGGVLGILASGRGSDEELRRLMAGLRPRVPAAWTEVFDLIQRDARELEDDLEGAGLEPLDVWEEHRRRRADPEAYTARIMAVASHLSAEMDPEEAAAEQARVARAVRGAAGPRGFEYTFVKLFGIARRRPPG